MINTTRKRILVVSIAGAALIGSGVGTAAFASNSSSTSTSAAGNSDPEMAMVGSKDDTAPGSGQDNSGQQPKISEKRATELAKAEAPGKVTEVELDDDDDRAYWEVEVDGKDNREHDLDVAADNGKILDHDVDGRDDDRDDDQDDRNDRNDRDDHDDNDDDRDDDRDDDPDDDRDD